MEKKINDLFEMYVVGTSNLFFIRNKNEKRVIDAMRRVLPEYPKFEPNDLDIQDIYALSLNSLPPRYVQQGTIVLREPVRPDEINDAVREAVNTVRSRPNYSSDE
ncbi:MAG: late competence development ComFB family protein [Proteobacteria bacterium]|nr:late competence development ComFB family protein [Pseudomonadota bacterium]